MKRRRYLVEVNPSEQNLASLQDRVQHQSVDEWLKEYERGEPVDPSPPAINAPVPIWVYDGHFTTKQQAKGKSGAIPPGLVLMFVNAQTGEELPAFFNVDTTVQRGKDKGKQHPTGKRGQFYPTPRSKFRKFWVDVVGREPTYWANAHKELRARLKRLHFTADPIKIFKPNCEPYTRLENLKVVAPKTLDKCENFARSSLDLRKKKTLEGIPAIPSSTRPSGESKYMGVKPQNNTIPVEHDYIDISNTELLDRDHDCLKCGGEGCPWCAYHLPDNVVPLDRGRGISAPDAQSADVVDLETGEVIDMSGGWLHGGR